MNHPFELRAQAVERCLKGEATTEVASALGVHPKSVRRWLRWNQEGGKDNLLRARPYRRPRSRLLPEIELRVAKLKEGDPALTIGRARELLDIQGIRLSPSRIWGCWRRHGLTGFRKGKMSTFATYLTVAPTPECRTALRVAGEALSEGRIRDAARILNALPSCPQREILSRIPDGLLTPKRRMERLSVFFGRIPMQELRTKAKTLRRRFEREKLYVSAAWAGILELFPLGWSGNPEAQLELVGDIKRYGAEGSKDPALCFYLHLQEGHASANLLRIRQALVSAHTCRGILRRFPSPSFATDLATLYATVGRFKEATILTRETLDRSQVAIPESAHGKDERADHARAEAIRFLRANLANFLAIAGDYRASLRTLGQSDREKTLFYPFSSIVRAYALLGQGRVQEAAQFAEEGISESKRLEIRNHLHGATLILASIYAALGEREKANALLKNLFPLLKKYRMEREIVYRRIFLGEAMPPGEIHDIPYVRLAEYFRRARQSLKARDYLRALYYARSQGLLGLFHRLALFFPEPALARLEKGRKTGLPRALLRLPVLRKEMASFHVQFLGPLRVYKRERALRITLGPKDRSFLIHLALSKREAIPLNDLYSNFWPGARDPSGDLSHLLVRIRKALRIPSHFLFVRENALCFEGHFTTDWGYFQELLTQAKALEREGECRFARREYLRAFALVRGGPFERMYDNWSEDVRLQIMATIEEEGLRFAREALSRKDIPGARRVLGALLRMEPLLRRSREWAPLNRLTQ